MSAVRPSRAKRPDTPTRVRSSGAAPRTHHRMPADTVDIVIVGAGVAGALLAWRLASVGEGRPPRILVLEGGEEGRSRLDLVGQFARAYPKTPHAPYISKDNDRFAPSPDSERDYDQPPVSADHKDALKSGYERRVGGSTWHWLGHTPRLIPGDFKMHTRYGVGVDWPISYDDLEPWYCNAEEAIGVAGDNDEWQALLGAHRSRGFPMQKVWPSYSDLRVSNALRVAGATFEGVPLIPLSTPSARNTEAYDARPVCAGNSSCVPLCPIGAKYDASVHVKKARALGVEVRSKCVVSRLEIDANGLISRLRYKTWDGAEHEVAARVVVIAGNAIETPRLLLASAQSPAEHRVANASGLVGCNLMDHLQKAALGLANEPLYPFRGPPATSGIDLLRDGPVRRTRSAFRISLGNDGWSRAGSPYSDLWAAVTGKATKTPLFGTALRTYLAKRLRRQLRLSCSTEVLPSVANRVSLSQKTDALGLPSVSVAFAADGYTKAGLQAATAAMGAILDAVGTSERTIDTDFDTYSGAGHLMGTTRMGSDPKSSVVDRECRSHDHRNLFIIGGSTFPTGGTANPTLTIAALALRAADAIHREILRGNQIAP